jgi:hypothetical protein
MASEPHTVRITVADNGCGIQPERIQKIFEAFFTTKQDVGKGLGLWLSQEIVQKHAGRISVKSRGAPPQSGTAFSIFWPGAPDLERSQQNEFLPDPENPNEADANNSLRLRMAGVRSSIHSSCLRRVRRVH